MAKVISKGPINPPQPILDRPTYAEIGGALLDLLDGSKEHDIQADTGLSEERCREIYDIYIRLRKRSA